MGRGSSAIYATLRLLFGLLVPGVGIRAGKPVVVLGLYGSTAATGLRPRLGGRRTGDNRRLTFTQPVAIAMVTARLPCSRPGAAGQLRSKRRETSIAPVLRLTAALCSFLSLCAFGMEGRDDSQARLERRAGCCARRGWTEMKPHGPQSCTGHIAFSAPQVPVHA
jgi:hypothetical protein